MILHHFIADINFFLSLLLFVFNLSYSIHVRCNFKNFNSRVRIVSFLSSRNINDSTININHLLSLTKVPKIYQSNPVKAKEPFNQADLLLD